MQVLIQQAMVSADDVSPPGRCDYSEPKPPRTSDTRLGNRKGRFPIEHVVVDAGYLAASEVRLCTDQELSKSVELGVHIL